MAALDFPSVGLTVGQKYPQPAIPGTPVYTWDGEKWTTIGGEIGSTGGADDPPPMDGIASEGVSTQWAREDHVHPTDAAIASGDALRVAKAGDTMTGHLSLPITPAAGNAVRKDYVDSAITTNTPRSNVVINGDFRVNQVGYVSAAALTAGTYGHDQWKAGAAGGDYSFTQLKSSTQITIASGKSLIQPIEDVNVVGGSYVLSWTGTAQARAGVNTLTPSGAYAVSPLLITGQTAGTVMSVEFNNGTLGNVKLESGATATPFVMRPYDQELVTCKRYFYNDIPHAVGVAGSTTQAGRIGCPHPVTMRAVPSLTMTAALGIYDGSGTPGLSTIQSNYSTTTQLEFTAGFAAASTSQYRPMILFQGGGNLNVDARL